METSHTAMNRRTCIGETLAATTALAAGTATGSAAPIPPSAKKRVTDLPYNPRTHKAMPTRNLGKTGFQVGIFSLGGQVTFEIAGKEKESVEIINRAIDRGINYIDTAAGYGNGVSEINIVGVDNIAQLEQNVAWASAFSPLSPEEMAAIEDKTLPIVREGLYFRRWDLGA